MPNGTTNRLPKTEQGLVARYQRTGCLDSLMALGELLLKKGRANEAADVFWCAVTGGHPGAKARWEPLQKRVRRARERLGKKYHDALKRADQRIAEQFVRSEATKS